MRVGLLLLCLAHHLRAQSCEPTATETSLATQPVSACASSFDDEDTLLAAIAAGTCAGGIQASAACSMMRHGWRRAALALLPSLAADEDRVSLRQFLESRREGASSVISLLRLGGDDGLRSLVAPAVQWAQNQTVVALAVRYSPKRHGPVSVSSVEEPNVSLNATHLSFDALARPHARRELRFELLLELHAPISPEQSSWTIGSAGRLTLTLVKQSPAIWPKLAQPAAEGARRGPITPWFEKQQVLGSVGVGADADEDEATPRPKRKKAHATAPADAPEAASVPAPQPTPPGASTESSPPKAGRRA